MSNEGTASSATSGDWQQQQQQQRATTSKIEFNAIVSFLENPKKFKLIACCIVNGNEAAAFQEMANFVNKFVSDNKDDNNNNNSYVIWTSDDAKSRYESYFEHYVTIKYKSQRTDFGITEEDFDNGLTTVEDKLESLCPFYSRMDALFGHRQNVTPAVIFQIGGRHLINRNGSSTMGAAVNPNNKRRTFRNHTDDVPPPVKPTKQARVAGETHHHNAQLLESMKVAHEQLERKAALEQRQLDLAEKRLQMEQESAKYNQQQQQMAVQLARANMVTSLMTSGATIEQVKEMLAIVFKD